MDQSFLCFPPNTSATTFLKNFSDRFSSFFNLWSRFLTMCVLQMKPSAKGNSTSRVCCRGTSASVPYAFWWCLISRHWAVIFWNRHWYVALSFFMHSITGSIITSCLLLRLVSSCKCLYVVMTTQNYPRLNVMGIWPFLITTEFCFVLYLFFWKKYNNGRIPIYCYTENKGCLFFQLHVQ